MKHRVTPARKSGMKRWSSALAVVLLVPGCSVSAMSENMHEHVGRTVPATGIQRVHIENVSGSVTVRGGSAGIRIDAVKNGSDAAQLQRTHVEVTSAGGEVVIKTQYDRSSWFSNNGASVDYRIGVPSGVALSVSNISGEIDIERVTGDVAANDVSGSVRVSLGRVAGRREVSLRSVSGG